MDISEPIDRGDPEDGRLEYKSKEVANRKIALELGAMANSQGGSLVLGVRDNDDGEPDLIQDVSVPHQRVESVTNVIYDRVEPTLDFNTNTPQVDNGKTVVEFAVDQSNTLHSFRHWKMDEPVFPVRRNTRVGYMHGHDVADHYEDQIEDDDSDEGYLRLPDGESSNYFIKAPDGHISDICLFSNIYYPGNPVRIHIRAGHLHEVEVEHIFAILEDLFALSNSESSFTINQSKAAWIGRGFQNFVYNLRGQAERYKEAEQDHEYELDLYGNEQAVFISNLDAVYPESTIIIYAGPFVEHDGYRNIAINFLIDGHPADIRPLIELSERTDLYLSQAHEVDIPTDEVKEPGRIPVGAIEQVKRDDVPAGENHRTVDGVLCVNPFFDKLDLVEQEVDLEGLSPLTKYDRLFAYLLDWDYFDEDHDYETKRFLVTDWNEFTKGVYANVKEIRFDVNW
ncbi:AlbA family DNA-binding domain-containing protein [Halorubrum aethiopicum]|uniref:AlbA family DNA-binding domain-containing protein n=1 Tax=Halorubrum aethiopicum TaxID=1758255 RepID=UPI0009B5D1B0|nr:ATP-binding protein [Halorubrum aethiopicum]